MNYTISNDILSLTVSTKGGEMQSIKLIDGTEYLWQGDVNTWPDRAINIFPYVARLTDGMYEYQGKQYRMDIHGFLPTSEMFLESKAENRLTFQLSDTEETRKCYPFHFEYLLHYKLVNNTIIITYEVRNKDQKTMHFGLGGHPGFNVPLEQNLLFEDYFLEFNEKSEPSRVTFSEKCFVTGESEPYPLLHKTFIPLMHDLFDDDAIVLKNTSKELTLKSHKGRKAVKVTFPQMDYLGLWHWPKTVVNYVCIEPWTSLPSREGIVEDLEKQDDLISLEAGNTYTNTWSIELIY